MKKFLIILIASIAMTFVCKYINAECNDHGTLVKVDYIDLRGNHCHEYDFNFDIHCKPWLANADTILIVKHKPGIVAAQGIVQVIQAKSECKSAIALDLDRTWPNAVAKIGVVEKITPVKKCKYNEIAHLFYLKK